MNQEKTHDIALMRYSVIAPLISGLQDNYSSHEAFFRDASAKGIITPDGTTKHFAPTTIKKWYNHYNRGGFDALFPSSRADLGKPRKLDDELQEQIKYLKINYPRMSAAAIYRQLRDNGSIKSGELSESTVNRYLNLLAVEMKPTTNPDMRRYERPHINEDINLEEQYLTVRRSMRYNGARHKTEIGATKRKKIRTVDFCDTLAAILKAAKAEQHKNRFRYGELYSLNYYLEVKEKDRTYYEVYSLPRSEEIPKGYKELSFVCLRPDGAFEAPSTVGIMCRTARKKVEGLEDFHFHMLRHTYTSNLLSNGAAPKDVQELLGHADVSTTMNIYAHATREAKRTSARLLDKVIGGE